MGLGWRYAKHIGEGIVDIGMTDKSGLFRSKLLWISEITQKFAEIDQKPAISRNNKMCISKIDKTSRENNTKYSKPQMSNIPKLAIFLLSYIVFYCACKFSFVLQPKRSFYT